VLNICFLQNGNLATRLHWDAVSKRNLAQLEPSTPFPQQQFSNKKTQTKEQQQKLIK
jgi:hypothetical protein